MGDFPVGEAHAFGIVKQRKIIGRGFQLPFHRDDVFELADEETVDGCRFGNGVCIDAQPQQLRDGIDAVIGTDADVIHQLSGIPSVKFRNVQVEGLDLKGADPLQQAFFKSPADAHHLTGGLHLGGKGIVGVRELVKGKTRQFCHHIVQ